MPPHPNKDIEVDLERKEELILAKQLRACRVSILPRAQLPYSPANVPEPQRDHVKKATSPIALRYWNQCMNGYEQSGQNESNQQSHSNGNTHHSDHENGDGHPPALPLKHQQPSPQLQPQPQKKISVPDIRRHMKEVNSLTNWEEVLQEAEDTRVSPSFYQTRKQSFQAVKFQCRSAETSPRIRASHDHSETAPVQERRHFNSFSGVSTKSQFSQPRNQQMAPKPPEASVNQKTEVIRILSTAGQGIKRDNERHEAKLNINRFITMDMLKAGSPPRKEVTTTIKTRSASESRCSSRSSGGGGSFVRGGSPAEQGVGKHTERTSRFDRSGREPVNGTTKPENGVKRRDSNSLLPPPLPMKNKNGQSNGKSRVHQDSDPTNYDIELQDDSAQLDQAMEDDDEKFYDAVYDTMAFSRSNKDDNSNVTNKLNAVKNDDIHQNSPTVSKSVEKDRSEIPVGKNRDVAQWANSTLLPTLSQMEINSLGLIFYSKMSEDLVTEITAQQLNNGSESQLTTLHNALETKVCDSIVSALISKISPQLKASLQLILSDGSNSESAGQQSGSSGSSTGQSNAKTAASGTESTSPVDIPTIVVDTTHSPGGSAPSASHQQDDLDEEKSTAESYLSAKSENPPNSELDKGGSESSASTDSEECETSPNEDTDEPKIENNEEDEAEDEEEEWEEGEMWEEDQEEYTVETFNGSFSVAL